MNLFLWRLNSFIQALLTTKMIALSSMLVRYRRRALIFFTSLFFFFSLPSFSYANVEGESGVSGSSPSSTESPSSKDNSSSNEGSVPKEVGSGDIIGESSPINIMGSEDASKGGAYQDEIEMRLKGSSDASSYTWNILRLIFSLIIVLLLAYFAIRLMRRGRLFVPNDDAYLKLVATLNIEQGKSIKVFTLGDKAYVIGVTATNVTRIAELEDKVLVDAMNLKADENTMSRSSSFAKIFSNVFSSGRKGKQKKLEDAIFDDSFLKEQQERLNNINVREEKEDGGE